MRTQGTLPSAYAKTCIIAIGANGSKQERENIEIVAKSIEMVSTSGLSIISTSRHYRTKAFPAESGPDFVNVTLLCETDAKPSQILGFLHKIEEHLGRIRTKRWGQRSIDLDLLCADDAILPSLETFNTWRDLSFKDQMTKAPNELILPHPRLQDRAFVLVPMNDVAPDWIHPVLNLSVGQMLDRLPKDQINEIVAIN